MIAENNPFNIRVGRTPWCGQVGSTKGFCIFDSLDLGVRAAALLLLQTYRKRGCFTISAIIKRFAPSSENNTEAYIKYVCEKSGYSDDFPLSFQYQYVIILKWMAYYESNTYLSAYYISDIIDRFKIKVFKV